jgi:group I intron endonuclease
MYIYKFTHVETNRCYIGQTVQSPNQRKLEHISGSRYSEKTHHFHNALKKYGTDSFTFEVIAIANSLEELNLLEEQYVTEYDSINNGFNIRQPGGNKLHNEKSKIRMSESQKTAHARRRETNNGIETHSKIHSHKGKTGIWSYSEEKRERHKAITMISNQHCRGKTWKLIDGKRVWMEKQ